MTELRSDVYILGTLVSPVIKRISGANNAWKWDEQAGFGLSGASLVGGTAKLSHFTIEHQIWEPPDLFPFSPQWLNWEAFKILVSKRLPGVRPPSLGIFHPVLADLNISTVVVEDRSEWQQDEYGLWTMTVKYIEYRAPMISYAKAGPGIPAAQKVPPSADNAHSAELAAARAERDAAAAHVPGGG